MLYNYDPRSALRNILCFTWNNGTAGMVTPRKHAWNIQRAWFHELVPHGQESWNIRNHNRARMHRRSRSLGKVMIVGI
jgi:hypothetical protein